MSLLSLSKKILNRDDASKKAPKKDAAKKTTKKAKKSSEKEFEASIMAGELGLHPIVTEKSIRHHDGNTITFRVRVSATKQEIAAAIEDAFDTKVTSVRTSQVKPKNRRRGQTVGKTNTWKKAYVSVEDIKSLTGGV